MAFLLIFSDWRSTDLLFWFATLILLMVYAMVQGLSLRHFKRTLLMQKLLADNMLGSECSFHEFLSILQRMMFSPSSLKESNFQFGLVLPWQSTKPRVKPSQMLASIFLSRCSLMANSMSLCLEGYQDKQLEYLQSQIRILTHQGKAQKILSTGMFWYNPWTCSVLQWCF